MSKTYIPLVDTGSNVVGYGEKLYCHTNPMLHLAFSLIVYRYHNNEIEFLLQQRSHRKYHCPGLWANTCCSHPKSLLSLKKDVHQRAIDELGLELDIETIKYIDSFIYRESLDNQLSEYELDHLFLAPYKKKYQINLNESEVMDVRWESINNIKSLCQLSTTAPWLKHIWTCIDANRSTFEKDELNKW